jgi:hypothetical protein
LLLAVLLEAKQAELEERRAAGKFAQSEEMPEARATIPAPKPKSEMPAADETFF